MAAARCRSRWKFKEGLAVAFQIKDFRSIVVSMLSVARASQDKVTDFSVGSVARTLMEAPATEIEQLYLQMLLGLQEAIPVAIYRAFDFEIVDALPASGIVTLVFPEPTEIDLVVPRGAVFEAPLRGARFFSAADVAIPVGSTQALVTVVSVVAGAAGNVTENEITQAGGVALPASTEFMNLPFTSGRDSESELERKSRFIQFVFSLSRGTVHAVRYAASLATVTDVLGNVQEFVTRIGLAEAPGHVDVYIYGSGGLPSSGLIASGQSIIDGYVESGTGAKIPGYRSAGVEVLVQAMSERSVAIGLTVRTLTGVPHSASLLSAITSSIETVIGAVEPGDVLRADAMIGGVLSISGVQACYLANDENVVCGQFEVLTPGAVTVVWLD